MTNTSWKKMRYPCCVGVVLLTGLLTSMMQAQMFQVLHTFTDGNDGANPTSGLTPDRAGNLYGTALGGGHRPYNSGTVYRLKRSGSSWLFETLYGFKNSPDGSGPLGRVIFGPDGSLYGTTQGGGTNSYGTVFRLTPPTFCGVISCTWTETVLYSFQGAGDGQAPLGDLIFDSQGSFYGTTSGGGCLLSGGDCGTVYQLTPSGSGWTHVVLYKFHGPDGANPQSGLVFDAAGNLYGTTSEGGSDGWGVVYELSPSMGRWSETPIHIFTNQSDGASPLGGLIFDASGHLLGTAFRAGTNGGGTAFELMNSDGQWNLSWLTSAGSGSSEAKLSMDQSGNLYGTTAFGGPYADGTVFKLIPSNDGWIYQDLHDFTGGTDGVEPLSNVVLDGSGNLYGTTFQGGGDDRGVVWEITP